MFPCFKTQTFSLPKDMELLSTNDFEVFVQTPGTGTGSHSQEPAAMYSNSSGVCSLILLELSSLGSGLGRVPGSLEYTGESDQDMVEMVVAEREDEGKRTETRELGNPRTRDSESDPVGAKRVDPQR